MNQKMNFVDERFELISVIFRLAGNWEYNIGAGGLDDIEEVYKMILALEK